MSEKRAALIFAIREKIASGEWLYTKHAAERVIERDIWSHEIEEGIKRGEIIEDYPKDKYGPSCLILGSTNAGRVLHIQVTHPRGDQRIKVITVYDPDPRNWNKEFTGRRSNDEK